MTNINTSEEVTPIKDRITALEEELKTAKECTIDNIDVKRSIEDFTIEKLNKYCKDHEDTPERVIARASEILINRHPHELNLIITQLCSSLSGVHSEEAEAKLIEDFNTEWLEHGLGFD